MLNGTYSMVTLLSMSNDSSFKSFIFRQHGQLMLFSVGWVTLHYIIFKFFFPHVIVTLDGHHYIRNAIDNMEISGWPIGYPKMLEGIHLFAKGDWAVGVLQYVLLEGAVLYFYFTVRYLLRPGKWVSLISLFFLLFNPFILFISNYIMSDCLFAAFTVLWFTATLWFVYNPRPLFVYLMIIFFFGAYTIRYYAMFYPLIFMPLILFSKTRWRTKLSGIALGVVLILGFRAYTESLFQRSIGQRIFAPLSGWRLAGNALVMYRHLSPELRALDVPPPHLMELHREVLHNLAAMVPPEVVPDRPLQNYFTFQPSSPLSRYCRVFFDDYVTTKAIKRWTSAGPLYGEYGLFLIRRHPVDYVRYYVAQGIDWYFHPKVDLTNVFQEGGVPILPETKKWFGYSSDWSACSNSKIYSIMYFPAVVTFLNWLFILGIVGYFFCKCYKNASPLLNKIIILAAVYWLTDFLFIIFTTPYLLRYAISGMIFNIAFVPVLFEQIYLAGRVSKAIITKTEYLPPA